MNSAVLSPSIVWLRDDLRIADNPALAAAVERGAPVVVLYLRDDVSPGIRPLGSATRWWLHHSLVSLTESLRVLGAELTLRSGAAEEVLPALVAEVGAGAVFWNRRYGAAREIDARLKTRLRDDGLEVTSFHANLLFEPWTVTTGEGNPYRVFTPFWRACLERGVDRQPLPAPTAIQGLDVPSDTLDDWTLLPTRPDWAGGLRDTWTPGEQGGRERLERFAEDILEDYHRRDEPGIESTSGLSPHLRFGEVSPFQVWHYLRARPQPNTAKFLSEIGWREFNWSILYGFPELHKKNYRPAFDAFPWDEPDPAELAAWKSGHTGIPLVDAGMRELWHSGSMHNRVRMVVASFLIKNLLVDWRVGEAWFWDTLVDADEASNPGNWQWVAGSGADAAPYFRVFNPILQEEKFDKGRRYVRRWVPEIDSPEYPEPIVDLKKSRNDALAAYEAVKAAQPL
ncbi:deoxyribodipyrimidine photo-lyase [Glaciihabitans arcticus]|uniref:Deoxyribodipyrimidine photo-lyase n=2 Tax=Glaciihabitans arcticus TaxID=2668039 RepID=A0A4Q9GUH0_9MICO|nr:deoxyribodipyrimidine photo-lyase [Glaciihabitans arcticus]TBN58411.1 deoxyribodipyrimidine photo-lyase [Glaciihabitans arcticus]